MKRRNAVLLTLLVLACLLPFPTGAQTGTIETVEIHSPALEGNLIGDPATRQMRVYLPPSYASERLRYPVTLLLHGFGEDSEFFAVDTAPYDDLMRSGRIPETILVMVDGRNRFCGSYYLSSETIGDYGAYITGDIVRFVDSTYRTIAHRESRGIYGYSMGGFGSLHLALSHPKVLGAAVGSAGVYDLGHEQVRRAMANVAAGALAADWDSFPSGSSGARDFLALTAGTIPAPNSPPFFVDVPFVKVDGEIQEALSGAWDQAWDRVVEHDVMHDVDRYLAGPERLRFIGFIHGRNDPGFGGFTVVEQARSLDRKLSRLGIEHTYVEHDGRHESRIDEALVLLADHLRTVPPQMPDVAAVTPETVAAIAGQPRLLDVRVWLDAPLETIGGPGQLVLDASDLGGSPAIPLARVADAEYAGRATVTPGRAGQFPLRVVLEADSGDAFVAHVLQVSVFADGPSLILDEDLAPGWSVTAGGGARPPVFDTTVTPTRGDVAAAFSVESASFVGWKVEIIPDEPISPFGYTELAFSFHPGDAVGTALVVSTGSRTSKVLVGRKAGEIKVDLERQEWQDVVIPMGMLLDPHREIAVVGLSGNLEGTFYIDAMRLVAVEPPAAATAVRERRHSLIPDGFGLEPNYPNPFNSGTVIRFNLDLAAEVQLEVYDVLGQRVATLIADHLEAGSHAVNWLGRNGAGWALASGVYFARLQAGGRAEWSRMMLVR